MENTSKVVILSDIDNIIKLISHVLRLSLRQVKVD